MNEVLKTIKSRRSVRAYTEQQISQEDLTAILEAATYAPSGMGLQTWHFTAIQNDAVLEELNEKIKGAFAKSDEPRLQERGHSRTYCCYYHAPTLVIVSNEPTQWWASMDCACAMQNIFLAAKSLGIGSCWINQLGQTCDDPDVQAVGRKLSHMLLKEGLFWNLHLYILPKCRIHRKTGGNCCVPVCCIPFLRRVLSLRWLLCISSYYIDGLL